MINPAIRTLLVLIGVFVRPILILGGIVGTGGGLLVLLNVLTVRQCVAMVLACMIVGALVGAYWCIIVILGARKNSEAENTEVRKRAE